MLEITVSEIMQTPVETISPNESVRSGATKLASTGFGSLVVSENDRPAGIVTDSDISQFVSDGQDPNSTPIAECMSEPLVTIETDETLSEAAKVLREHGIKRLPVVDESETIVGIVTTSDLSNYIPHLSHARGQPDTDAEHPRESIRTDTAYERSDWDYQYFGAGGQLEVGDYATFSKTISESDVEEFAEITGDTDRIHLDEEYAQETAFGERIAHGGLVGNLINAALTRFPGSIIYLSQELSYLRPVPLDERVTARCEVVERLGGDRYRIATSVHRGVDEVVIEGESVVISEPPS